MGAARDVGKGLVDGNTLDEGREIADHFDGGVAQPLVFLEMPADKGESWTEFARLPSRHAAANPKGPGFVRSCKHNSTTDCNGFATQRRVKQLLYGGIEGIQVRMKDGGCRCHPDRSPVTFRGGSLGEHNKNKDDECQAIDEVLEAFVRKATIGVRHASCSCRMGRADDAMAVVDTQGRVKGVQGLRVVDASIFPLVPSANTNFPTPMAAEKSAEAMQ
jgi:GMC oxidoreductase